MKIAIYGAGNCGEYIIQAIKSAQTAKVEAEVVIDNNPCFFGERKHDLPIVNLEEFISSYQKTVECVLIAVWDTLLAQEMAVTLLNRDYNHIYFLPENMREGRLPVLAGDGKLMSYIKHISFCKPIVPSR